VSEANYKQQITVFLKQSWPHSTYENNYAEGHRLALRRTFSGCAMLFTQWQADDVFNGLLRSYVLNRPTHHWDINCFGAELPEFIVAQQQSPKGSQYPWRLLADIAVLEYALASCYYGKIDVQSEHLIDLPELLRLNVESLSGLMNIVQEQHRYAIFDSSLLEYNKHASIETIVNETQSHPNQLKLRFESTQQSSVPRLHLSPSTPTNTARHQNTGNSVDQSLSLALHANEQPGSTSK